MVGGPLLLLWDSANDRRCCDDTGLLDGLWLFRRSPALIERSRDLDLLPLERSLDLPEPPSRDLDRRFFRRPLEEGPPELLEELLLDLDAALSVGATDVPVESLTLTSLMESSVSYCGVGGACWLYAA